MADDYLREKPASYLGYTVYAVSTGDDAKDVRLLETIATQLPGASMHIKAPERPVCCWGNKSDQTDDIEARVIGWREEIMSEERAGHQHGVSESFSMPKKQERPVSSRMLVIHGTGGDLILSETPTRDRVQIQITDPLGLVIASAFLGPAAWEKLSLARYTDIKCKGVDDPKEVS